ncbi:zinc finger protein 91-like isoform X2 [Ochlerotatus camptorhynchus]|uniref:zinc finger protein 91-like isoform X2 n=1 Tax=Ochlerotatus camptorhynchus TaxID=644619 RepID=UPI0031CE7C1F
MDTSMTAGDDLLDVPNGDPATYCRLCTSEVDVEELFPDGQGIRQDVIDRIQECTGIQITLEDDYPSAVCWMCLISLEEFQWFRERCHRYDVLIRRKRKQVSLNEDPVVVVAGNHSFDVVMEDDEGDYDDDDEDEPDGPVLRISSVQENVRTIEEDSMLEISVYQPAEEEEEQLDVKPDSEMLAAYAAHFMVGGDGPDALDATSTSEEAERRFKCNLCSKTFKNRANLWEHNRLHTGNLPFSCKDCGTTFSRVKSLMAHKQRYHSKDSTEDPPLRLQCKFCPRVFPRKGDRTQHMKMGHPDLYDPTDKMEAPTPTLSSGRNTPAASFGASSAVHVLPERKAVAIKKSLSSSTPTPSPSTANDSNSNCTICMKSFQSGREMEDHVSNDHPKGSIMPCPFCPKTFKSRQTIRMHILNHQGKLPYKCDDCDARFDRKFYLQKHRERYHQGDNHLILKCRFRCKFCPRLFQRKIDRKTHTRMVHLKEIRIKKEKMDPEIDGEGEASAATPTNQSPPTELSFGCLVCGKQFASAEKLRNHTNIHHVKKDIKPVLAMKAKQATMRPSLNVRRPFKCPYCPKTFAQKYVMTEHTFIHTGSLRYPCDKCMAMFNRPHYLRAHQLKYHGKDSKFKAIKCRFCTRSFVRKQDIKIHERIAHNVLQDDGTVQREIIEASQNGNASVAAEEGVDDGGGEVTTGTTGTAAPYVVDEELDDFDGDDDDYDDGENGDYVDTHDLPENPEIRDVVVTLERIPEDVLETLDNSYDDYEEEHQAADDDVEEAEEEPNGDADSASNRSTETPRLNMSLTLHRCPKCHKVFKTRKSLKHHMIYHQNQLPFSCDECGVQFPRNRPLQVHKQRYHSEDAPYTGERFSCDYCPRIFLRDRDKLFHQKTVHSLERAIRDDGTPELKKAKVKRRKDYVCLHCCERFETEKSCQRHINVVHPDESPVKTPCDSPIPAMLVTPKLEPEAESTANDDGDDIKPTIPQQYQSLPPPPPPAIGRPYKLCRCSTCVAIFKNRDQWDDHFQTHPNVRPHHCEECLLKRKSKNRKTTSVGFKCQHCPKVFTKANTLRTHQRLHTSELRFPCDECGMMYDRYRLLQAHKDKYHSEDSVLHPPRETFRCMYCPRTFMRQRDCNFHQESVHAV